jgi:non-specific serine/threonine protein kinase
MDIHEASSLLAATQADRQALRGPDADTAMGRLDAAYPDLTEAFNVLLGAGRVDDAIKLAAALVPFWMATSRIDDGDRWFTMAVEVPDSNTAARARALYEWGYLVFWAGRYDRSRELSEQALILGRAADDPTVTSLALGVLARIALNTDVDEAIRLLQEAIAVTEGTDDRDGRSSAMHVLGVAFQMSGRLDEARAVMSDRIALGLETGNEYLVAIESGNLSMVERQLGNLERAEQLSRTSLEIMSRRGDELAVPWIVNGLAAVTAARGDIERAATLNGYAEAGIERAGGEWPPDERQQFEWTLEKLRAGMDHEALQSARAAGAAMSMSKAVEFGLSPSSPHAAR